MRHEHRTLPGLIALGVLLGAGLALATPAGHPVHDGRSAPGATLPASPSSSATASPTSSTSSASPSVSAADGNDATCAHRAASPGWAAGHPGLTHAIHVLLSSCGRTRGNGLQTAIEHVQQAAERHSGNTHAGGTGDAHRQEPGMHDAGRGGHTDETGRGGDHTTGYPSNGSDPGSQPPRQSAARRANDSIASAAATVPGLERRRSDIAPRRAASGRSSISASIASLRRSSSNV
jgi:hypothetical protein